MPMWPTSAIPAAVIASACARKATPPSNLTARAPASHQAAGIVDRLGGRAIAPGG